VILDALEHDFMMRILRSFLLIHINETEARRAKLYSCECA